MFARSARVTRSRALVLTGVGALTTGLLVTVPSSGTALALEPGPTAVEAGAAWLIDELTDGLLVGEFGPDTGLSIDAAMSLHEVGGYEAEVQTIADAVAADVDAANPDFNYVSGEAFDDEGSTYAGAVAKVVVMAQTAGRDVTTYGGEDFVARLASVTSDLGPDAGRIADVSSFGDNANAIGQSFAARALTDVSHPEAGNATDYLLSLQCADGSFALEMPDAGEIPGCDPEASGSVDVTSFVILNLAGQAEVPTVAEALDDASAWLLETRQSVLWGSDADIPDGNSNSTGLAVRALTSVDAAEPVLASLTLRALQADDPAPCASGLSEERGAMAYDLAARDLARAEGITDETRDQFRRVTAQALPALLLAQDFGGGREETTLQVDGFRKAGSPLRIRVDDLPPGDTVCFARNGERRLATVIAGDIGDRDHAAIRVRLPSRTTVATYRAFGGEGLLEEIKVLVLGRTRFDVSVKKGRIRRGGFQKYVIKGLVTGERYTVKINGRTLRTERAESPTVRFGQRVTKKYGGRAKVQVKGEFGQTRRGFVSFEVR